jgi:hypothetical protein
MERVGVVTVSFTLFQATVVKKQKTYFTCSHVDAMKYLACDGTSLSCYSAMLDIRYATSSDALPPRLALEP